MAESHITSSLGYLIIKFSLLYLAFYLCNFSRTSTIVQCEGLQFNTLIMAAKPFTKEQLNFLKFSTLVLDEFSKVLREIFVSMWNNKIAIKPGFITWDDSTTVRSMLLTSEGGKSKIPTTKSIEEWDCTSLFQATIYGKTFGVPGAKVSTLHDLYLKKVKPTPFHLVVQSSTGNHDETYALVIDQLRLLRNTLCHSPKLEMSKTDFDYYIQLVTNALTAVNIDTAFVNVIGGMSEDDFPTKKVQELEERLLKEKQAIKAISMHLEDINDKLSEIHAIVKSKSDGEQRIIPGNLFIFKSMDTGFLNYLCSNEYLLP